MIIESLAGVAVYAVCGIGRTIRNEDFKRICIKTNIEIIMQN